MERTKYTGDTATQMHFARRGVVTPEMARKQFGRQLDPKAIVVEIYSAGENKIDEYGEGDDLRYPNIGIVQISDPIGAK